MAKRIPEDFPSKAALEEGGVKTIEALAELQGAGDQSLQRLSRESSQETQETGEYQATSTMIRDEDGVLTHVFK